MRMGSVGADSAMTVRWRVPNCRWGGPGDDGWVAGAELALGRLRHVDDISEVSMRVALLPGQRHGTNAHEVRLA